MLTLNEEWHLPEALEQLRDWVDQVFIVDSLSTDRTVEIALEHGATVVQRPFTNFGDQWNWALTNLPITAKWTMKLDPDERLPVPLRHEIATLLNDEPAFGTYELQRRLWFMGRPMRQIPVGHPPLAQRHLPVLRRARERAPHHARPHRQARRLPRTPRQPQPAPLVRQAERLLHDARDRNGPPRRFRRRTEDPRQRARTPDVGEENVLRIPGNLTLHWLYLYFGKLAILDGRTGWQWASLRTSVYRWAKQKALEMRRMNVVFPVPRPRSGAYDDRIAATDLQRRLRPNVETPAKASPTKKRLKVAVNGVSLSPGGGLVVLEGLLKAWKKADAPVDLLVYASREAVIETVRALDVPCTPFARGKGSAQHFARQQYSLGPVIAADDVDVVLTTNSLVGRCPVPQLVHHQNLKRFMHARPAPQFVSGGLSETVKDVAARQAMKRAAVNVFISHYLRRVAERIVPESLGRNHVVFNGVDDDIIPHGIDLDESEAARHHIISLQSDAVHKDNPTLMRMFARVLELAPDKPWRMTAAGAGMEESCLPLARELGIIDRVDFPGYLTHDKLDPIFAGSLCMVFTSVLEGFGNPPLEAMVRGCPVVAVDCTAIPEVVGDAGILVRPHDAEAFARSVVRLAGEPALRRDLAERGFERAQGFRWSRSAEKLIELLHVAADAPRPTRSWI